MRWHLRLWRRVRIFPWLTMNLGKHGVSSFTYDRRGLRYTVGRKNQRVTVGLPGSGIFISGVKPVTHDPRSAPRS